MLITGFILVTITFFILIVTSFKMGLPRISYPLGVIYLAFLYYQITDHSEVVPLKTPEIIKTSDSDFVVLKEVEDNTLKNEAIASIVKDTFKVDIKSKNIAKPASENLFKEKTAPIVQKMVPKKNQIVKNRAVSNLVLKDIKICKYIKKRTPVGSDVIFSNNVDSLYCYTRIQNKGKKREVKHIWYYEDRMMTQVRYNVRKSNTFRSWTRKTIYPHQVGKWRVDIHDNNGTIIGSLGFEIKKLN